MMDCQLVERCKHPWGSPAHCAYLGSHFAESRNRSRKQVTHKKDKKENRQKNDDSLETLYVDSVCVANMGFGHSERA